MTESSATPAAALMSGAPSEEGGAEVPASALGAAVLSPRVVFTSGATESNNLALLGLAPDGELTGRRHIISCVTEHKAVLEPLEYLSTRGFEVELMEPGPWTSA